MADTGGYYPPASVRPRAVLVRNIPRLADAAAVDEFFSFCGAIESRRLRPVVSAPDAAPGRDTTTLEAVVVFADDASRRTALLMNESTILDEPVAITAVPDNYHGFGPGTNNNNNNNGDNDNNETGGSGRTQEEEYQRSQQSAEGSAMGFGGGLFAGVGDLFSNVGSVVSAECRKAATMLDAATESGVLKTAKDQAELARQRTVEMIHSVDEKYHVQERAGAVAGAVTEQTRNVATVVASQSKTLATQVDSTLKITENTRMFQEKAMQNPTLNAGVTSVRSGIDNLLTQTGLAADQNRQRTTTAQEADAAPRSQSLPPSGLGPTTAQSS